MTVRLRGALPAEEMNGLARIEEALTRDPKTKRLIVGVVDVARRVDHGDGQFEPTVQFVQVELLEGKARERGLKLLQTAYGQRTGAKQLDGYPEDDTLDDAGSTVGAPPATVPPIRGLRYTFEPGQQGKWWLTYRDETGDLVARTGPIGVQADLTLGKEYTLETIDALGDRDLSVLARSLERRAEDDLFDAARPAPGEASQYADENVAATITVDEEPAPQENAVAFSDKETKEA